MNKNDFKFIKNFRIGSLEFDLYKNKLGEYKTVSKNTEAEELEEQVYANFIQLNNVFSEDMDEYELNISYVL
jgi:hypothetical protein